MDAISYMCQDAWGEGLVTFKQAQKECNRMEMEIGYIMLSKKGITCDILNSQTWKIRVIKPKSTSLKLINVMNFLYSTVCATSQQYFLFVTVFSDRRFCSKML